MGGLRKLSFYLFFSISLLVILIPIDSTVEGNANTDNSLIQECIQKNYKNTDFLVVRNIQKFLYGENFYDGKISGYLDDNLLNSIKKFQEFVGIRIDGIMGPSTHKAMTAYNNCTGMVEADLKQCSGYMAYKECTFFVNALKISEEETTTPVNEPVCDDETFKPYTLYTESGNANTVMSCRNESDALKAGYVYYSNPAPPSSSSSSSNSSSGSLIISNLNGTVSIDENQKSVVTISASGTGGLSYALSGTDAHLMSVNSSGVVTLNSNADYEQKTSYTATATVTDSVGSTSKTLSVSVADITEYATVKVVSWYDDATLTNCVDNIIVNNSVECGINTPSKYATRWEETEIWQNKWLTNSVVDLRVDTVTIQEWTSLTTLEENAIALDTYDPLYVFASNEQVNKHAIRNGIHFSHLLNTWASANQNQCSAFSPLPSTRAMQRHFISRGIIKGFTCFAHEFGHTLGLKHAVNQATNPATYEAGTYYYGYYDSTNNIGTTMSYDGLFCMMYSNPDIKCPTQAERDAAVAAGTYDSSNTDIDKVIDGTWGSITAGKENEADAARFMNEYLRDYERSYPSTNYGVDIGSEYVSTLSLFPQIDGASASYSYTEGLTNFTSNDSLTMYSSVGSNQTESSVTYSNLSWCTVQNCDIIYGNPFAWETKTGYNARFGIQFYFNEGNLYTKRALMLSQFLTNDQAIRHISYPTPCLQLNKYMRAGEYLETDCTSNREDTFGSKTNYPAWNFSNVVGKELVVTPYGAFDAYKIITSHARWDNDDGDYDNIKFDYQTLIFWVAPDTGLVMFQDEQYRRWKLTAMDTDGDGTDNKTDTDDDNDGVLDVNDALPLDPNSSTDNNNDGRADEDE